MFEKIRSFWSRFWNAFKDAYNTVFKDIPEENTQDYRDTSRINFLSVFVNKLNNLANTESTFAVESDSTQTERLAELCADLEAKRFDITAEALGTGDYWVFPAHNSSGELYHRYITQDRVRVLGMDGDELVDVMGIIDEYSDAKDKKTYFLVRRHTLEDDALTVETYATNEKYERVPFEPWAALEVVYQLRGASHIGVGRFKSPASSRGLSPVYGVPINYGCEEIEAKIFGDLAMIETEFERAESKIFADPLILRKGGVKLSGKDIDGLKVERVGVLDAHWTSPEGIFPISKRAGDTGSAIDIFSPAIRYSSYRDKLLDDMQQYEQQVGTDRGFLTPFDDGKATTATEIRRANASTIALIDKIHTAIKNGVEMTLAADAVFLNISPDLYTVKFDFFDPFEDADKQYERLANAVDRGIAEKADEIRWLFPDLSEEEIEAKIERIGAESQTNTDTALESLLNGGA